SSSSRREGAVPAAWQVLRRAERSGEGEAEGDERAEGEEWSDRGRGDGDDAEGASAGGGRRDDAHDDGGDPHARAADLKHDESGGQALVPLANIREVATGRGLGGAERGTEDRRGGQSKHRCDERQDQGRLPQGRRLRRNRCPGDTA